MTTGEGVVIAGAGATGLALACGLLAAGVPVRVVDKAAGPATTSRALGLQPRGSEVLDRLGVLGDLPDRSIQIARIAVHVNGLQTATLRVGQQTPLVTRPGLLVSQAEIEAALRARLDDLGGSVEWNSAVVTADQDGNGVTVGVDCGRSGPPIASPTPSRVTLGSIRAGWLVGCDGAHSKVRKLGCIGFPGVPLVERFLLADVRADLPFPATLWPSGSAATRCSGRSRCPAATCGA